MCQRVLCSEHWKGSVNQDLIRPNKDLGDRELQHWKKIETKSLRYRTATAGNIQLILNATRKKSISKVKLSRGFKTIAKSPQQTRTIFMEIGNTNFTLKKIGRMFFLRDESKLKIHGNKQRVYVRRQNHEKFISSCIRPTVKHGGGNIQV